MEHAQGHDLITGTAEELVADLEGREGQAARDAADRFRAGEAGPITIGRSVYAIGMSSPGRVSFAERDPN
ncbi:hypothetical protein ACQVDT_21400 [Streptomyces sp. RMIT01]